MALLRRWLVGLVPAGLVLLIASTAVANQSAEAIRLEYSAPPSCPTEAHFRRQVTSRVPSIRPPEDDETPRLFETQVEVGPDGAVGHLTITEPSGEESSRLVESNNCTDLVEALALIVALAIDPHAAMEPRPSPPAPPPPPPLPKPPEPPPPPAPEPPPPSAQWQAELFLHALVAEGLSPGPLPGARFGAGIGSSSRRWLLPSGRLSFAMTAERTFTAESGAARFRWMAIGVEACPLQIPLLVGASIRPCALGEWGWIQARGVDIDDSRSVNATWLATGGLGNLGVATGKYVRFEARGAAVVPSTRDRFFLGSEIVHRHLPVAWRAEIGFAVRFP